MIHRSFGYLPRCQWPRKSRLRTKDQNLDWLPWYYQTRMLLWAASSRCSSKLSQKLDTARNASDETRNQAGLKQQVEVTNTYTGQLLEQEWCRSTQTTTS